MKSFKLLLSGGDRRSLGRAPIVSKRVKTTKDLDQLFLLIYSSDRTVAMRAIDTLEKVTRTNSSYLNNHGNELMNFARNTSNKEIKWHIAQLLPRIDWTSQQHQKAFALLNYWASNPNESKIVRANALEAMYNLCSKTTNKRIKVIFRKALRNAENNPVPSLAARARRLRRSSKTVVDKNQDKA